MHPPRPALQRPATGLVAVGLVTAVLVGCGGGGGGGPALLTITAANQETVSRAAATSIVALSSAGAVPVTPQSSPGDLRSALAARAMSATPWVARVLDALAGRPTQRTVARAGLKRPLALIGPVTEDCGVSGTVSLTLDDRDGDGDASPGDRLSFIFEQCVDTPGETVDGAVDATLVSINADGTALTADFALTALSATTNSHAVTLGGTIRVDYSTPDLSSPVDTFTYTARGDVTAQVSTHLTYADTLTLRDGWRQTETFDASVAPVAGNVEFGKTTLRVNGTLHSQAAGDGAVTVSTSADVVSYGEDAYPREGAVTVRGSGSALRLTALSVDDVRIELDTDGDGTWESATTRTWDWLV